MSLSLVLRLISPSFRGRAGATPGSADAAGRAVPGRGGRSRALLVVALALLAAGLGSAHAAPAPKPDALELRVFLKDKPVGTAKLRKLAGKEGLYYATEAQLQDKIQKVWRSFTQRAHLVLNLQGEFVKFDRWIDVTGATTAAKLYQYEGAWKVAFYEGAKPRVVPVAVQQPLVVLDERMVSLVLVAADRMAGRTGFDFVRLDNATFGQMTMATETLVDKAGDKYARTHLRGGGMDLEVLRDDQGRPVAIKGIDGWSAVVAGRKIPQGLTIVASPAPATALPAAPTPDDDAAAPPAP